MKDNKSPHNTNHRFGCNIDWSTEFMINHPELIDWDSFMKITTKLDSNIIIHHWDDYITPELLSTIMMRDSDSKIRIDFRRKCWKNLYLFLQVTLSISHMKALRRTSYKSWATHNK